MNFFQIYLSSGLIILGFISLLWLISLKLLNSSIIDIFWGAGFVIFSWVTFLLTPDGYLPRKLLLNALVTVWGLRLSLHILIRNWHKSEDFRYRAWREEDGSSWWWRSFFKVFLLQGSILWLVAAPLVAGQIGGLPDRFIWLDYLAVVVWLIGFTFEAVGDWQLKHFKANPANQGKVLQTGVWRYTRHPNYFGDSLQWWAYYLIALAAGGWWTVFSPVVMTALLLRVSGVTMLEKTLKIDKPGYQGYMETTSEFVPWFPRKR